MRKILVAFFAVILVAACSKSSEDFSLATYRLAEGEGEYDMSTTVTGTIKLGALAGSVPGADEGGNLPVELSLSGKVKISVKREGDNFKVTIDIGEVSGEAKTPEGSEEIKAAELGVDTKVEQILTPEGEPVEAEEVGAELGFPGIPGLSGAQLVGFTCPRLSGEEIAPGDTWETETDTPVGEGSTVSMTTQNTYREEQVDGKEAAVLESVAKGPIDTEIGLGAAAGALGGLAGGPQIPGLEDLEIGIAGEIDAVSTCVLEIPDQRLLATTSKGSVKLAFAGSDGEGGGPEAGIGQFLEGFETDLTFETSVEAA